MKRLEEDRLRGTLARAIGVWLGSEIDGGANLPHLGGNTVDFMAAAALQVLLGMEDAQDDMAESGMLKED